MIKIKVFEEMTADDLAVIIWRSLPLFRQCPIEYPERPAPKHGVVRKRAKRSTDLSTYSEERRQNVITCGGKAKGEDSRAFQVRTSSLIDVWSEVPADDPVGLVVFIDMVNEDEDKVAFDRLVKKLPKRLGENFTIDLTERGVV